MMKYKNLFIDLDDTLWDTYHNNKECLKELYADYKMDRHYASFEAFFAIYMPHNEELWAKYRNGEIDRQTLIIDRLTTRKRYFGSIMTFCNGQPCRNDWCREQSICWSICVLITGCSFCQTAFGKFRP